MSIDEAFKKIRNGGFVLIHDASEREDETDMIIAAESVEPRDVARMRQDAGGLICVAVNPVVSRKIDLPFLSDIYKSATSDFNILNSAEANDLPYDERSAFSIYVNHRDTFTGITDKDRALTISEMGKLSKRAMQDVFSNDFGKKFRTPGHVPLLKAAENLLEDRKGHTEMSLALMEMAETSPCSVVCEMLDGETGKALSVEKAKAYSEENDMPFLEAEEVVENYKDWKEEEN